MENAVSGSSKLYLPQHVGKRESVFENQYMKMYRANVQFQDFTKEYFVTEMGERVAVMFLDKEKALLVRQYRFLINDLSWELPGGAITKDETAEQAAIRECLEETGIRPKNLSALFEYNITLDCLDNYTRIFCCSDFEFSEEKAPDMREVVETAWVPLGRCLDMIAGGEIRDSMTMMGLLYYAFKEGRIQREDP